MLQTHGRCHPLGLFRFVVRCLSAHGYWSSRLQRKSGERQLKKQCKLLQNYKHDEDCVTLIVQWGLLWTKAVCHIYVCIACWLARVLWEHKHGWGVGGVQEQMLHRLILQSHWPMDAYASKGFSHVALIQTGEATHNKDIGVHEPSRHKVLLFTICGCDAWAYFTLIIE